VTAALEIFALEGAKLPARFFQVTPPVNANSGFARKNALTAARSREEKLLAAGPVIRHRDACQIADLSEAVRFV
jgi:hypothetical protein